jgi:hypothetical protein
MAAGIKASKSPPLELPFSFSIRKQPILTVVARVVAALVFF